MKVFKRIIMCLVASVLFMINTNTVFATGLAGDEVVSCNITVNVIDISQSYTGDSITVSFKDITGTVEETIELTRENSWGDAKTVEFSLPAPTTYNITISGVEDGYSLVNTVAYEEIVSFAATEGNKDFMWAIIDESTELYSGESNNSESEVTITNTDNGEVGEKDAEAVYQDFLDAVSFIETDPTWSDGIAALLNQYGEDSINRNTYSQWYADYVRGGSQEEYFAMTSFEQFLWTETYTRLAYAVGGSNDFNHYFADEASFKSHVTDIVVNLMNGNNSNTVVAAYEKLMAWQYEYVKANGVPFNFISNRNYIEEISEVPVQEDTAVKTEEEEIDEALAEVLEEEKEEGIWDSTMSILAENALTILLLAVLLIAVAVVVFVRKQKNIDDIR